MILMRLLDCCPSSISFDSEGKISGTKMPVTPASFNVTTISSRVGYRIPATPAAIGKRLKVLIKAKAPLRAIGNTRNISLISNVSRTSEMSEILRVLPMARRGALAFINTFRRLPIAAGVAGIRYPTREEIVVTLKEAGVTGIFVPEILPSLSNEIEDGQQSNSRINIIMLGVFCSYTQLLPRAVLENSIVSRLPQFAEQNLRTFSAGWGFAESLRAQNMA